MLIHKIIDKIFGSKNILLQIRILSTKDFSEFFLILYSKLEITKSILELRFSDHKSIRFRSQLKC
jgi:hypothetical protein